MVFDALANIRDSYGSRGADQTGKSAQKESQYALGNPFQPGLFYALNGRVMTEFWR